MAAGSFSDEELRRELKSHGISVGPITETTRNVLLRKLNNLRNSNSQSSSNRTTTSSKRGSSGGASMPPINSGSPKFSLNSFSSDESEPDDNHNDSGSFSGDVNATIQSSSMLSHAPSFRVTFDSNNHDTARRSVDTSALARPSIRSYANGPAYGSGAGLSTSKFDLEWRRLHSYKVGQSESSRTLTKNNVVKRMFDWHHTWQVVSSVLIVLVLIFAVVVIASYVYIARAPGQMSSSYSVCNSAAENIDDVNCAISNENRIEKQLVDSLLENLINRAGEYDCGYAVNSRRMSKGEVETFIVNLLSNIAGASDIVVDDWRKKVYCLMNKNSDWGVKLLNENGDTVVDCDSSNIQFLESQIGRKTLWCRLVLSARTVFTTIAVVLALGSVGVAITLLVRQRQKWAEAEQQEVFDLVEQIVDVLKQNADLVDAAKQDSKESHSCPTPCLAIAHVRDALIPLHLRQKKQAIWDKAVRFLSANESRVRAENQKISGEGTADF